MSDLTWEELADELIPDVNRTGESRTFEEMKEAEP